MSYTVYERTGSTVWLAATMVLTFGVVGFLGPFAGALGDRFDRRRVMIASEGITAACWMLIAFVPEDANYALLALAFAATVCESPFRPAASAAIPNLAGPERLAWANSLIAIGRNLGLTLGPLLGGVLVVGIGARGVFVLNALSFLGSLLLVLSVKASFEQDHPDQAKSRTLLSEGVRWLARDKVLRLLLLSWCVFLLGSATTIIADPVLADHFGTGALGYGLITAFWGGGKILGSWLSRGIKLDREGPLIVAFSGLVALSALGVAVSPWFPLVLFWVAIFGLADGPTQVIEQNLLQRRTVDQVRSTVIGTWESANHAALVIAFVIGGFIVPIVGPKGAYAFGALTGALGTCLLVPLIWWLPRRGSDAARRAPEANSVADENAGTGM